MSRRANWPSSGILFRHRRRRHAGHEQGQLISKYKKAGEYQVTNAGKGEVIVVFSMRVCDDIRTQ